MTYSRSKSIKVILNLVIFLGFVSTNTNVYGEARVPQLVVTDFIKALQNDDMDYLHKYVDVDRIKQYGYTVEKLKEIFIDVDLDFHKIEFSKPIYKNRTDHDNTTKVTRVRMVKPFLVDFDLLHQSYVKVKPSESLMSSSARDFYRIMWIHQYSTPPQIKSVTIEETDQYWVLDEEQANQRLNHDRSYHGMEGYVEVIRTVEVQT